jgi:hypothetical protein
MLETEGGRRIARAQAEETDSGGVEGAAVADGTWSRALVPSKERQYAGIPRWCNNGP